MKSLTDKIFSFYNKSHFFPVFQKMHFGEIHLKQDESCHLVSVVAIHSTLLGPALGGCRLFPYRHINEAIIDSLRLAQAMSYKAALCEAPFGGGKAVIMRPQSPI